MKSEQSQIANNTDFRIAPKPNKRQLKFIDAYLTPSSPTFANVYQSAKAAGYSDKTARVLTANSRQTPWVLQIKEYLTRYEPEHIYRAMQHIAENTRSDRDRLRALELMGKHTGMFIERHQSDVNVRFTNQVPRPVLDLSTPENPPIPDN